MRVCQWPRRIIKTDYQQSSVQTSNHFYSFFLKLLVRSQILSCLQRLKSKFLRQLTEGFSPSHRQNDWKKEEFHLSSVDEMHSGTIDWSASLCLGYLSNAWDASFLGICPECYGLPLDRTHQQIINVVSFFLA